MAAADLEMSMDFEPDFSDDDGDESFDVENYNPQKTTKKTNASSSAATKGGGGVSASKKKASTAAPAAKKKTGGKTIEETYQKKTQLEHILLRPDTYIGSTESVTQSLFVLNPETSRFVQRDVTYTPGLFKIYDEILVNAADNKQRDPNMDRLEVDIDPAENVVSVLNNGKVSSSCSTRCNDFISRS